MPCDKGEGGCIAVQSNTMNIAVLKTEHKETRDMTIENRKNVGDIFKRLTAMEVRISTTVAILVIIVNLVLKYLLP